MVLLICIATCYNKYLVYQSHRPTFLIIKNNEKIFIRLFLVSHEHKSQNSIHTTSNTFKIKKYYACIQEVDI